MGKFSNKIQGGMRNVPISQRQRARVLQMLDVHYDDSIPLPNLSTLVWNDVEQYFELLPYGGTYGDLYDSASFTVSSGTTDYNVAVNQITLFDSVPSARYVKIITDHDISVKFNVNTNDAISITSTENPFEFTLSDISNIFITTGASNTAIQIVLIG